MLKVGGRDRREVALARLSVCVKVLDYYISFLNSIPTPKELHPFYREMAELTLGSDWPEEVEKLRRKLVVGRTISFKFYKELSKTPMDRIGKLEKEAVGRSLSFLRRNSTAVEQIVTGFSKLSKLAFIDPSLPTVIVAGLPNVGKSSIVASLSSAKLEIASYPFTTKDIHVGHLETKLGKVQIVDTPGLLDRPNSERNIIEKKAVNALRNLNGVILFAFDGTEATTVSEELNVFEEVVKLNKPSLACINKMDIASSSKVKRLEELVKEKGIRLVKVSCVNGDSLEELKVAIEDELSSYLGLRPIF